MRIGKQAFFGCKELREIEIPACVEEIGQWCFNRSSLSGVTFAAGSALRRIGKEAFSQCRELSEIEIPDGVQVEGHLGVQVRIRQ